ncbi:thiol oxidoreductase [Pararhodobacter marinus]|uniref:Thiol oxidoreductase n=1 Tax=Pararhodobacter marinus TaxID=2184063 RepID=A0A2U2CBA4_9RHOB|nr:di-heme oxidoredictase family protein [Pararhodobacter marinus]PWE29142.1 thiol oxidoreductase [Pararhodobacter marinus]
MRCSTPRRWTKPSNSLRRAGLILALPFAAFPGHAQDLGDLHLNALPRTEQESARAALVLGPPEDPSRPQRFELRSGGAGTVRARSTVDAFAQPAANLTLEQGMTFELGEALFSRPWASAPASTTASDGLGPLFNARACADCHPNGGRAGPPDSDPEAPSRPGMFLRVAIPAPEGTPTPEGIAEYISTLPDPVYGDQLQDDAIQGQLTEYRLAVSWEDIPVTLEGGETVTLRRPDWQAADPGFGPLHEAAMLSPRVAPPLIGLGLIETIATDDILALADPDDADGDGISGRANIVWSREFDAPMLGRFGLKAGMPTVREQSASAFFHDVGLSSSLFPQGWGDCTEPQAACRQAPDGGDPQHDGHEISDTALGLVTFFITNLGVPARRDVGDPEVLRGRAIFREAGCAACHRPSFVTRTLNEDRVQHSFQLIWPYSDFLLHDMGEGLADGFAEARATGREWRTPPLWGIGLTEQVSGRGSYLHDGRARSLLEAILWHGGEAQSARDTVVGLAPDDRAALLRFLRSL